MQSARIDDVGESRTAGGDVSHRQQNFWLLEDLKAIYWEKNEGEFNWKRLRIAWHCMTLHRDAMIESDGTFDQKVLLPEDVWLSVQRSHLLHDRFRLIVSALLPRRVQKTIQIMWQGWPFPIQSCENFSWEHGQQAQSELNRLIEYSFYKVIRGAPSFPDGLCMTAEEHHCF